MYQFTFWPTMKEGTLFPTRSPAFVSYWLVNDGHSDWCEVVLHNSFNLHFSVISDVEHLFMCLLAIHMSFLEKCLLGLLPIFPLGCFSFCCWVIWVVCIEVKPCIQSLIRSNLFIFVFISIALGDWHNKYLYDFCQRKMCLCSLLGFLWFRY